MIAIFVRKLWSFSFKTGHYASFIITGEVNHKTCQECTDCIQDQFIKDRKFSNDIMGFVMSQNYRTKLVFVWQFL